MKTVLFLSSCVVFFVGYKVHHNKKLKRELYISLKEMNRRLEECYLDKEPTPELINPIFSKTPSPSPEPTNTGTSTPGSYTLVTQNLSDFST